MDIVILIAAMVVVGLIAGWVAGLIWKDKHPLSKRNIFIVAIISAIVVGLMDWFVIPAMGFSTSLRNMGVAMEPFLGALLVLWIFKAAKK